MNLYELIMQLPVFIQEVLELEKKKKTNELRNMGRFHLGLNYDMLIWLSNTNCRVFPC